MRPVLERSRDFFWRRTDGFEPAADVDLGVCLTTKVQCSRPVSDIHFPLEDGQCLIAALDDEPMRRVLTDCATDLALKLFQARHPLPRRAEFAGRQYSGIGLFALITNS